MKKIFMWSMIAVLAIGGFTSLEAKPPKGWHLTLKKAQAEARKSGKPIMVVVSGSDWCPPCKALQKIVLNNRNFINHAKRNAVLCFIDIKRNSVNLDSSKLSFFKGVVPAYACVDHRLKVLEIPSTRTVKGFNEAITKASRMLAKARQPKKPAGK